MRMSRWIVGIIAVSLVMMAGLIPTQAAETVTSKKAAKTAEATTAATAAATAAGVSEVKTTDLQSFIATLENDDQRKAFLATLKTAVALRKAEEARRQADAKTHWTQALLSQAMSAAKQARDIVTGNGVVPEIKRVATGFTATLDDPTERQAFLTDLLKLLVVVSGGLLALAVVRLLVRRWGCHLVLPAAEGRWWRRLLWSAALLGLDAVPALALALTAVVLLSSAGEAIFEPSYEPTTLHDGVVTVVGIFIGLHLVWTLSKTLLTPRYPHQHLLALDHAVGERLRGWLRGLGSLAVIAFFSGDVVLLLGVTDDAAMTVRKSAGFVLVVGLVAFIRHYRRAGSALLRGFMPSRATGEHRPLWDLARNQAATHWHTLAIIYIIASYIVWASEVPDGLVFLLRASLLTAAAVSLAVVLSFALHTGAVRLLLVPAELRCRFPYTDVRGQRYVGLFETLGRRVLGVVLLLALLHIWGLPVLRWFESGIGQQMARAATSIGLAVVLALLVWAVITTRMDRYLSEVDEDATPLVRSGRMKTFLPLLRNLLFVLLVVVAGLVVLDAVGFNTAPLLAGAGVVGLAVGFGSQKLVQDIITGVSILFEDTIAVGDVVDLAGHIGEVESLSIRSLKLRDFSGHVHTVPFSALTTIVNMTKGHSYAVLDTRVRHSTDTDMVTAIMTRVTEEMRQDPAFSSKILDPIDVKGVESIGDTAVKIMARLKTVAGKQWEIDREFNRRLLKAVKAEGISLAIATISYNESDPVTATPATGTQVMGSQAPFATATPTTPPTQ